MSEPKIQQLYEDVSSNQDHHVAEVQSDVLGEGSTLTAATIAGTGNTVATASGQTSSLLPAINARPNSAARGSHVISTPLVRSSRIDSAKSRVKQELPLTPLQALEKYSRHLTPFEQDEIVSYSQIWFVGPRARKINGSAAKPNNFGYDDDKGRYKCVKHDHLGYRYEIMRGLGKGSFGDVVETFDHKTKQAQAVKIIRNERRFHRQAQIEIKILEQLKRNDRKKNHHVVHINEYFTFRNHLCITFDLMHQDLYSALKKDSFKGFTLPQVGKFCKSLLSCLRLLRRQRIIHCDLKPENILLNERNSDDITVIDFGSACLDHQKVHSYIQSRFYRAPEVILGMGYSIAIDMWSLGCILAELFTGQPIFPGRDEKEQLMYQMEILGCPPSHILQSSKRFSTFFQSDGTPRVTTDRKGRVHVPGSKSLSKAVGSDHSEFINFLERCFDWDPSARMSPKEASRHPWVTGDTNRLSVDMKIAQSKETPSPQPIELSENPSQLRVLPNVQQFREVMIPSDAAVSTTRSAVYVTTTAGTSSSSTYTTNVNDGLPFSSYQSTVNVTDISQALEDVAVSTANQNNHNDLSAVRNINNQATRPKSFKNVSGKKGSSNSNGGADMQAATRSHESFAVAGQFSSAALPKSSVSSTPVSSSAPTSMTSLGGKGVPKPVQPARQAWGSIKLKPLEPQTQKPRKKDWNTPNIDV